MPDTTSESPKPWWKAFTPAHFSIILTVLGAAYVLGLKIEHTSWEVGKLREENAELKQSLAAITTTVNTAGSNIRVLQVQVERIERNANLTFLAPEDRP